MNFIGFVFSGVELIRCVCVDSYHSWMLWVFTTVILFFTLMVRDLVDIKKEKDEERS
mgnify:FL=1